MTATNRNFLSDNPAERTAAWATLLEETKTCIATLHTMFCELDVDSPRHAALLHAYLVVKADMVNVQDMHRAAVAAEGRSRA